jgi:hypothetical protein
VVGIVDFGFIPPAPLMTVWAKKIFPFGKYEAVEERIGQLQIRLGAPYDLMMLEKPISDSTASHIFIGLPRISMLVSFEGFEEVDREHLPDGLVVLIARKEGFESHFPDIAAKLKRARR